MGARRKRGAPGADKNAPRGLLTTSTLAARPRCKNIEFYGARRNCGVPGANTKELKTRVNGSTGQRARVNGIGLGGRFGGATPVR